MLIEGKSGIPVINKGPQSLLKKAILQKGEQEEFLEDRVITYVSSLKLAAHNHNRTKQEAEIYTDWANHYLEKARYKKYIEDLQVDVTDGILLADVIEAVTNEKVRNINRKPKSSSQMIENITSCLCFLAGLGVNVEGILAKDIREGNLKSILSLFFSLSRYKQQQKQGVMKTQNDVTLRLPSPQRQTGVPRGGTANHKESGSNIPTPTSTAARKQAQERNRISHPSSVTGSSHHSSKTPSASSSRSASPSASSIHSLIPQPTLGKAPPTTNRHTQEKQQARSSTSSGKSSAVRPASGTSTTSNNNNNLGKNSMLDKFKFFNSKDKSERNKVTAVSKRTSSSSGFSSARSERSDSSNSLCSEPKPPASFSTSAVPSDIPDSIPVTAPGSGSPRLGAQSFTKKTPLVKSIGKSEPTKPSSPKTTNRKPETNSVKSTAKGKDLPRSNTRTSDKPSKAEAAAGSDDVVGSPDATPVSKNERSDNGKDYTTILEPDNPIKQSKVSLIPKGGEKSGKIGATKEGCQQQLPLTSPVAMNPVPGMPNSGGGNTNIPKPTAAIKGTSKVSKDERTSATNQPNVTSKSSRTTGAISGSGKVITPSSGSKHSTRPTKSDASTLTDPPKPVSLSQSGVGVGSSLPRNSKHDHRGIAMVSPMQSVGKEVSQSEQVRKQETPIRTNSKLSTHSKVETTFDSADKVITRETNISGQPQQETTFSEEGDDIMVNIKPMQPIVRASPYSYMRSLGVYSLSRGVVPSVHHVSSHALQADNRSGKMLGTQEPTYASTYATYGVPMKGLGSTTSVLDADYASNVVDPLDLVNGYMSDGDVLRSGRSDDIASGYMSEGGASLYARRVQARLKENLAAVKECMHKSSGYGTSERCCSNNPVHLPAGFDDSSSVSSGISDTIAEMSTDENLTGSSVSSDHTNPYASLKRAPKEVSGRNPYPGNGCAGGDRSKKAGGQDVGVHGRSSAKGNVKKADIGQQTENSAFRQVSGSAWKKYVNDRDGNRGGVESVSARYPQDRMDLLRRGKSDLDPSKTRDKRGCTGGVCPPGYNGSGSCGGLRKSTTIMGAALNTGVTVGDKYVGCSGSNNNGSPKPKRKSGSSSTGKHRTSSENVNRDRTSPRTSRSGSLEPPSQVTTVDRKVQNVRALAPSQVNGGSGKRPTSSGSASSTSTNGSVKSSGSTRVSVGKLSDLNEVDVDAAQMSLSDAVRNYVAVSTASAMSAIPRPGSVPPKMGTSSSDHQHQRVYGRTGNPHEDIIDYGRNSLPRKPKPYPVGSMTSMTSPTVRDRTFGSRGQLNQSPTPSEYSSRASPRLSVSTRGHDVMSDGGTSYMSGGSNSTYAWLRQSPSVVSSLSSAQNARTCGSLTEAESMESLASLSSVHSQLQHARANSLTPARLLVHQRETSASPGPRLARSSSIRSTKSEKLYPSMLQRSGDVDVFLGGPLSMSAHNQVHKEHHRHTSQPTSPTMTHQGNCGYSDYANCTVSSSLPTATMISPYMGSLLSKINSKDGELHGSALSLVSTNSSLYSSAEDKQAQEIQKLRRELIEAHDKVQTLTSQLSGNRVYASTGHNAKGGQGSYSPYQAQQIQAHVVAAFEQSLSNMTCRLQTLTASAEQKDSELNELRSTIESLRKRSAEAGLTSANFQSTQPLQRTPHLVRRHTFNTSKDTALQEHRMSRQLSTDSMSSINSASSACSVASQTSGASQKSADALNSSNKKKKKKGWLRSSFSKAFSRSKKNKNGSVSDVEDLRQLQSDTSVPNSPLLNSGHGQGMKVSHSSSAIYDKEDDPAAPEVVVELKKQLREKDMVLTDIRLEALSSAHQLESLKETVTKMKCEMMNLKQDNERLQRLVTSKSLTSSQSSLPITDSLDHRLSASEISAPSSIDLLLAESASDSSGKKVTISVLLGCHGAYEKYMTPQEGQTIPEVVIGSVCVSGKTKWDLLDTLVRRTFKEYVLRVDPVSNLGLNAESVTSYHLSEVSRSKDSDLPDLLPCGYVVGNDANIRVTLKGTKQNSVDALAFETLIPKSILQRYISLLSEHRRIILCGPSGTGKTYLAQRLSEYLILRSGKDLTPGVIATFSVDHKSAKELRQYLSNVAEQCESSNPSELPSVIILDNLHHVGSLGEVFNGFLNAKYQKCPYIIGTMNQTTCSTTNLQLHHNFRWVLCANHMEPVKGFLGRYLRRKLIEHEVRTTSTNNDLTKIIDWMSKVWQHLNKFLETHSSSDVTIGPRLFLSCPIDIASSQVWFTDLWNYSIVPYLLDAVREGLQLYGRRAPWEDPMTWVMSSYPWPPGSPPGDWPALLRLRHEDVGYDGNVGPGTNNAKASRGPNDAEADPLLSMLMRLQEAASYSSPQSNDSDNTSLDSHGSSHPTEENVNSKSSNVGVESTL